MPIDEPTKEEELASVPWDALLDDERRGLREWAWVAAVGLVVAALSAGAVQRLWPVSEPEVDPAAEEIPEETSPPVTTQPISPPSTAEADLLAVDPTSVGALAAWYVADYFTTDTERGRSFVERAEPVDVRKVGADRYAVVVLVSVLESGSDDGYRRLAGRAVEVVVELGEKVRVLDLPRPVEAPDIEVAPPAAAPAEAPPEIVSDALSVAERWGRPQPETLSVGSTEGGWRVEVTVVDEVGLGWPLAIWFDPTGRIIPPPA